MRQSRKTMKPGQMFHFPDVGFWPFDRSVSDVLVVVDAQNEVGFWRGGAYRVGAVAPSCHFTVVA